MTDIMEKHDEAYFKSLADTLEQMYSDVEPIYPQVGDRCLIPRDLAEAAIQCAYVLRGDVKATREFANAIRGVATENLVSTMLDTPSDSDSENSDDTAAARVAEIRQANAP